MKIVGPERLQEKVSTMFYKVNPKLKLENIPFIIKFKIIKHL